MYIYIYIYGFMHVCLSLSLYIYIYVYTYTRICIHMHTYMHASCMPRHMVDICELDTWIHAYVHTHARASAMGERDTSWTRVMTWRGFRSCAPLPLLSVAASSLPLQVVLHALLVSCSLVKVQWGLTGGGQRGFPEKVFRGSAQSAEKARTDTLCYHTVTILDVISWCHAILYHMSCIMLCIIYQTS